MRSYARHQLKENPFATSTAETISWAVENRSKLIAAGVALAVIVALLIGGWFYVNYRNQQAATELSGAIEKYNTPIRPAGMPASPDVPSFGSGKERAQAANTDFVRIADKYSYTQTGHLARYFAGVTFHEMGNNAAAEKDLKEVAGGRNQEVGSLAKMALASIYHDTNRNAQAIELYKQLIDHPTASVGKSTAQFMLGSLYEESHQPDQAKLIYLQMQKDNKGNPIEQLAVQRLQSLKQ